MGSPAPQRAVIFTLLFVLTVTIGRPATVRADSARDYLNAPIDTWMTFYNFSYAASVTPEDGLDVTSRSKVNVQSQSVVLTRTMDIWGRTGGFSIVLPYRHVEANTPGFRGSQQGISDLSFLWQVNIFGGPALTREEFASFIPKPFASFHLFVGTPLGKYNPVSPLNPSSNRWTISSTVNYSYTPDAGLTWLETYVSAAVFTTNSDFRAGGASYLTQKPLFVIEGHASRNITPELWALGVAGRILQGGRRDQHRWYQAAQCGKNATALVWRGFDPQL